MYFSKLPTVFVQWQEQGLEAGDATNWQPSSKSATAAVISHKVGDKTTPLRRRKCHPWQKLFSKVQKSLPILAGRVTRPLSFLALWVFLPLIFCPSSFFSPSECSNRNVFPDSKVVWRPVYQSQNFWPNLTIEVIAQNNRTQSVQVSKGLCNHSVKSRILGNIVKVVNHW